MQATVQHVLVAGVVFLGTSQGVAQEADVRGANDLRYHVNVLHWGENEDSVFYPRGINDKGQIGLALLRPNSIYNLWRYDPKDGAHRLSTSYVSQWDINKSGDFAATFGGGDLTPLRPFIWTEKNGLRPLQTTGVNYAIADAISDDGQVAGWADLGGNARRAVLWDRNGTLRILPDLPGGLDSSTGHGISPKGDVVVGHSYIEGGSHAFRWTERDGMQDLGDLPGGNIEAGAFDVNDKGVIVGYSIVEGATHHHRAFRWTEETGMVNLGTLRAGHASLALGINEEGTVVGWSGGLPGGTFDFKPFIWTEEEGMRDIHALLDEESRGWLLAGHVGGINDRGEIPTHGRLGDRWATVLLTPVRGPALSIPEPASFLTLALILSMARLPRRSS